MNGLVDWVQRDLFRWLELAIFSCIWVGFPILLALFLFKKLRVWVGFCLLWFSYLAGFACWILCFIVTYRTLGGFWLIAGIAFMGVGVFPLALVGIILRGLWATLPDLLFAIALTAIPRLIGGWIVSTNSSEV